MRKVAIAIIKFYRKYISPLFPPTCRFIPTCSEYALQAYGKYGFFKATGLVIWRILRCNPLCKGGYDPLK